MDTKHIVLNASTVEDLRKVLADVAAAVVLAKQESQSEAERILRELDNVKSEYNGYCAEEMRLQGETEATRQRVTEVRQKAQESRATLLALQQESKQLQEMVISGQKEHNKRRMEEEAKRKLQQQNIETLANLEVVHRELTEKMAISVTHNASLLDTRDKLQNDVTNKLLEEEEEKKNAELSEKEELKRLDAQFDQLQEQLLSLTQKTEEFRTRVTIEHESFITTYLNSIKEIDFSVIENEKLDFLKEACKIQAEVYITTKCEELITRQLEKVVNSPSFRHKLYDKITAEQFLMKRAKMEADFLTDLKSMITYIPTPKQTNPKALSNYLSPDQANLFLQHVRNFPLASKQERHQLVEYLELQKQTSINKQTIQLLSEKIQTVANPDQFKKIIEQIDTEMFDDFPSNTEMDGLIDYKQVDVSKLIQKRKEENQSIRAMDRDQYLGEKRLFDCSVSDSLLKTEQQSLLDWREHLLHSFSQQKKMSIEEIATRVVK